MDDTDWDRLIRQLRRGDCIPLLGAGASHGRLPTGQELSEHFAEIYRYPFDDYRNLSRVMQYAAVLRNDPTDLKVEVCTYLKKCARPSTDPYDPHTVLSEFPIKTFITTNYDNFMSQALLLCGSGPKSPGVTTSPWWDTTAPVPPVAEPDPGNPLVHHLHGDWDDPPSLVLTEDDYLTYMSNLVNLRAENARRLLPIPLPVLQAMVTNPLLFVGYSFQDWNFRVLFHELLTSIAATRRRRHISVQLLPALNKSVDDAKTLAHDYLQRYFHELKITIYVGSTAEFFRELVDRNARTPT